MILAVDANNTHIIIGAIDNNKIHFAGRITTEKSKTPDEYAIAISNIIKLNHDEIEDFEGCIISSVVPHIDNSLKAAVLKLTGKTPVMVGPGVKTGLNLKIEQPSQLGSDIVAVSVAAANKYQKPIIIINIATATTVAVLDEKGAYIGGAICPGVSVGLQALSLFTAQLPSISLTAPKSVIGKNTTECMKSGVIFGHATMIDGIIERIEAEMGQKATVIATGMMAEYIIPICKREIIFDKYLLFDGLNLIYQKNINTKK